ncbi:MAG: ABC transporter ATP-binding protein [Proteobacteria bacterium]|nr:ABC transporter ATP-binding protein [Pseudomonadota bacterium]MBI3496923.1 ABC transporter ATP-binding protein [Pseudomonadota bacterium]
MVSLLEVSDLAVSFQALDRRLTVVDGISFRLAPGEVLGVVGESGSGKSVTALSIMRLLGEQGAIDRGRVELDGRDLTRLSEQEMLSVRGQAVSMIFQEPMTSLNPVYTVGLQIAETLVEHLGIGWTEARARAVELMGEVGIPAPAERLGQYPHQLSGGMRQRVMVAIAIACSPLLLIADEPTTALDVTIQAQILELMRRLRDKTGAAIMMITHDLGVIADIADRVIVMYAGQIVEEASVADLFERPQHPYTRLLLRSVPLATAKRQRLEAIAGATPSPRQFPSGCRFHPRCPDAVERCRSEMPVLERTSAAGGVRCWRAGEPGLLSGRPS